MTPTIRIAFNCLVVALLTWGGVMLVTWSPVMDLSPFRWGHDVFGFDARWALGYVFRILVWFVGGGLVALLMLGLKPRRVAAYAGVSWVTFIVTLQSWQVLASGELYNISQELIWILTVPGLYWLFARIAESRGQDKGAEQE